MPSQQSRKSTKKRRPMRDSARQWFAQHPLVTARLTEDERDRLNRLLMREQQGFGAWLRDRINEQELVRNPDSQGGVKKVIPEDLAQDLWELAQARADEKYRLAQKVPKRAGEMAAKSELLKDYGKWCNHTAFLSGVIKQYQEVRVKLDSGIIKERHRPKAREYADGDEETGSEVRAFFGG